MNDIQHRVNYHWAMGSMIDYHHQVRTPIEEADVPGPDEGKIFTTLETNQKKSIAHKGFLDVQENSTLDSWTTSHPMNWTNKEVLDWVFSYGVQKTDDSTCMTFTGAAFNDLTGEHLCNMSKQEFVKLEPTHGPTLHRMLQELKGELVPPEFDDNCIPATVTDIDPQPAFVNTDFYNDGDFTDKLSFLKNDCFMEVDGHHYDFDLDVTQDFLNENDDGYDSSVSDSSLQHLRERKYSSATSIDSAFTNDEQCLEEEKKTPKSCPAKQRVKVELGSDGEENEKIPTSTRGRKSGSSMKGNHLWEFMRDILNDNQYEALIKWEDRQNGVFRLLKSEEVAKMWGKKKNNKHMTYEKLSRALRFCRGVGYFEDVPKDGKYPKKLVFKFGKKAYGYK